jgi:hypothetical protein
MTSVLTGVTSTVLTIRFKFDESFTAYCCGATMRDFITKYHRDTLHHKDTYHPWTRYKKCLCETILDSFVVFNSNGEPNIITKSTASRKSTILIDDDFYIRLASDVGKKNRYIDYFRLVPLGSGNNHKPWKYECLFLNETCEDIKKKKAENDADSTFYQLIEGGSIYLILILTTVLLLHLFI